MTTERVSVHAGGSIYSGWTEISIQYAATQAARAATLTTADARETLGGGWPLVPGTDVEIYAGGSLLVRGFVETFAPEVSDTSHSATVTIISTSKDMVESAATHPTGEIRNKRVVEIAREIDPTKTDWTGTAGEPIALFRVRPGETVHEAVERAARGQGVLLVGRETGGVEVVEGIRGHHAGVIREGTTSGYTRGSSRLSLEGRHSEIKVRGQAGGIFGDRGQVPEGIATVPLPRARPKIVILEGEAASGRLKKRAEWEARQEAGVATTASLELPRWRDDDGRIFEPAYTIEVSAPDLRLSGAMAIRSVTLRQGPSGTLASLELVDPRGLGGEGGVGSPGARYAIPVPKAKERVFP